MTVVPTHPTFLFPRLKIKRKGSQFDMIEAMEAELQVVMNIHAKGDCCEGGGGHYAQS
jgi:hypothetical protein